MRRPSGRRFGIAGIGNLRRGAAIGDLGTPDGSDAGIEGLFDVIVLREKPRRSGRGGIARRASRAQLSLLLVKLSLCTRSRRYAE